MDIFIGQSIGASFNQSLFLGIGGKITFTEDGIVFNPDKLNNKSISILIAYNDISYIKKLILPILYYSIKIVTKNGDKYKFAICSRSNRSKCINFLNGKIKSSDSLGAVRVDYNNSEKKDFILKHDNVNVDMTFGVLFAYENKFEFISHKGIVQNYLFSDMEKVYVSSSGTLNCEMLDGKKFAFTVNKVTKFDEWINFANKRIIKNNNKKTYTDNISNTNDKEKINNSSKEVNSKEKIKKSNKISPTVNVINTDGKEKIEILCPICKCDNVTKIEMETASMGWFWPMVFIVSVFGGSIHPIILLIGVIGSTLAFISNRIEKSKRRHQWKMKCNRCNHEFYIDEIIGDR